MLSVMTGKTRQHLSKASCWAEPPLVSKWFAPDCRVRQVAAQHMCLRLGRGHSLAGSNAMSHPDPLAPLL